DIFLDLKIPRLIKCQSIALRLTKILCFQIHHNSLSILITIFKVVLLVSFFLKFFYEFMFIFFIVKFSVLVNALQTSHNQQRQHVLNELASLRTSLMAKKHIEKIFLSLHPFLGV
ncbi:hypothetical protein ACJX0J_007780, partial [Zea mays]